MSPLNRRRFISASAAGAVGAAVSTSQSTSAVADDDWFRHGIASGDPLPDAVVLWTRVSPTPGRDTRVRHRPAN